MATLRVLDIVEGTSVDGPGLRTTIYFAGCNHHCPGCHNPQSWDPDGGREMSVEDIVKAVDASGFNVTFSGGDPLLQAQELIPLAAELRKRGYTIWCFTGYMWEDIRADKKLEPLWPLLDVLVDGPFVQKLRDTQLLFRGSSNQRLIDIPATLASGRDVVEWRPQWI